MLPPGALLFHKRSIGVSGRLHLRLLHTSDWHLGHDLHGHDRAFEHELFLDWLIDTCYENAIDALIVAGDIFDSANPPARAQAMYFRFLAKLRVRCPQIEVVIVGGNHDSAMRLDAPLPLLAAMNVHVVGGIAMLPNRHLDFDRLCRPLSDREGNIKAWCIAMPYLRPSDLPKISEGAEDPLIEGVRVLYQELFQHARSLASKDQAILATGHCYMAHTKISELSERKVLRGNQHALPADIFPEDIAYVALGHLHRPQKVGPREAVRYSGSPLPLSLAEQHYPHQVVMIHLEGPQMRQAEAIRVPRAVAILRLPEKPGPMEAVLRCLSELPDFEPSQDLRHLPYLEVQVLLEKPQPGLRQKILSALEGKAVRLAKISPHYTGSGKALAESEPEVALRDLQPEVVFTRKYEAEFDSEPPEAMRHAFFELLEDVQNRSAV